MTRQALIGVFLLGILFPVPGLYAGGETGGEKKDSTSIKLPKNEIGKTVISQMTDQQLVTLIGLLFEMDSIPEDMIEEITRTVELRKKKTGVPTAQPLKSETEPLLPGSQYYTEFNTQVILPLADMWGKKDTTYILDLFPGSHTGFFMPTCGVVSSKFGWRDSSMHNGIDLDLKKGDPVNCVFDGVVRFAGRQGNYGNVVLVRHYNGLETIYAHLSKIRVKPGQKVEAGQALGLGGMTGRATGPHLHFEIRFKGLPINPAFFISFDEETLSGGQMVVRKTRHGVCAYPTHSKVHVVKKGDNLWEISKRYGTTPRKILDLNGVSGKYMKLKPGMEIRVI